MSKIVNRVKAAKMAGADQSGEGADKQGGMTGMGGVKAPTETADGKPGFFGGGRKRGPMGLAGIIKRSQERKAKAKAERQMAFGDGGGDIQKLKARGKAERQMAFGNSGANSSMQGPFAKNGKLKAAIMEAKRQAERDSQAATPATPAAPTEGMPKRKGLFGSKFRAKLRAMDFKRRGEGQTMKSLPATPAKDTAY